MSPDFVEPPDDVSRFPSIELRQALHRIHRIDREPWYFANSLDNRFDLINSTTHGTCYFGTTDEASALETLGYFRILTAKMIDERRISLATPRDKLRLADTTDPRSLGNFGLSLEVGANLDYAPTQRWAEALQIAGFDGIHYASRHDPSGRCRSVALFGTRGLDPLRLEWGSPMRVPAKLLDMLARVYGIEVMPG